MVPPKRICYICPPPPPQNFWFHPWNWIFDKNVISLWWDRLSFYWNSRITHTLEENLFWSTQIFIGIMLPLWSFTPCNIEFILTQTLPEKPNSCIKCQLFCQCKNILVGATYVYQTLLIKRCYSLWSYGALLVCWIEEKVQIIFPYNCGRTSKYWYSEINGGTVKRRLKKQESLFKW